jgi:hypothetical protein
MIEISFQQSAPEGMVFAKDAFRERIGQEIPFQMAGKVIQATVVDVMVNRDGHWALVLVQLPVTFPPLLDGITVTAEEPV